MDSFCTHVELHRIKLVKFVADTACTAYNAQCGVLSPQVARWVGFEANNDWDLVFPGGYKAFS
jgi:hypothetical protein